MSHSQENIPTKQRAWVIEGQGDPRQALRLREDRPVSKIQAGEVLVKVQAAALNPLGWKLMHVIPPMLRPRHSVPEFDFAGVIVDAGDTTLKQGDSVFGTLAPWVAFTSGEGTLAEYIRVPSTNLAIRPASMSPVHAAGIPLAGQTALQALSKCARIEAGQNVLINGGSTAVGIYATQIAKAKGAKVVVTCSPQHNGLMKELGADEIIDYTAAPVQETLTRSPPETKFHAILDAVGLPDPSLFSYSPSYLVSGGVFVTTGPEPKSFSLDQVWFGVKTAMTLTRPVWLGGVPRSYKMVVMQPDRKDLDELRGLCEEGKLRPIIDSIVDFENALEAYDKSMSGHAKGKVIVKIAG